MARKNKRQITYEKFNGKCAYCGCDILFKDMHLDHITPKYRGTTNQELEKYGISKGSEHLDNLNPSCASCNSSKSTFTVENWRKELELKHTRLLRDNSSYRILHRFGMIKVKSGITFYFETHGRR